MDFTVNPPGDVLTYKLDASCWQLIIGKPEGEDLSDYILFKKEKDCIYIHRLSGFHPNILSEPNLLDQSTVDTLLLSFLINLYKRDEGLLDGTDYSH